jgi:predicted SAM-dependent methyltransferase
MKLHIGCGKKFLPGYKHLDVFDADHIDYVCDAGNLSLIDDETVSEIYACHIFEHIKRDLAASVLKEWNRVLKPDGEIRIAVPDFEAIAATYSESKDARSLQGLLYGGQTYDYNFHHVAYDFEMLSQLLYATGYKDVSRYDWRDFLPPGFDDYSRAYLPHLDFDNGRLMSLNLKAVKA